MSKKIGFLSETASKVTGEVGYMGKIDVAGIEGKCALVPQVKRSDRSPDYEVQIYRNGRWLNFGAAWTKTPTVGGDDFLSLTIDHELMEKAVYCAAFPPSEEDDEDQWAIVWGRPRGGKARDAAEALEDEIPF